MNEELKYQVIKELADHGGNKLRAAVKLDVTVRTINRYIAAYKSKGKAAFVHGNRHRPPANSLSKEISDLIVSLYREKYDGFNIAHYKDLLSEYENIDVSYATVYRILNANGIRSPHIRRATRKKLRKAKLQAENPSISETDLETVVSHQVALEDAHPRQHRCKFFGEEIQMDGSLHLWFGERKAVLHLAIDNATRTIVGAFFDWQETLNGYYHVFDQILRNYGIPAKFKTDNRSVFYYRSSAMKDESKDVLTQFNFACRQLGVQLETTSVSQAKGIIERANQTFQYRLVNELSLHHISSIEQANQFLIESFVPKFNRKFADSLIGFPSVFETSPSPEEINCFLAVLSPRIFDSGSSVKYHGHFYQTVDENDQLVCFRKSTDCIVIRAFDGQLFASVDDQTYALREVEKHAASSPEFDSPVPPKPKKRYIPPMTHPWKQASFLRIRNAAHQQFKIT